MIRMQGNSIQGRLSLKIITLLSLPYPEGTEIRLSPDNIQHMITKHPGAYGIYAKDIPQIISSPDYVGINHKDCSIEFVKQNPLNGDYIKVAVRASANGVLFVRSIYVLNSKRVNNFIINGQLKKV
jgi:hypothetical protein